MSVYQGHEGALIALSRKTVKQIPIGLGFLSLLGDKRPDVLQQGVSFCNSHDVRLQSGTPTSIS
jgi:hypothetical protein